MQKRGRVPQHNLNFTSHQRSSSTQATRNGHSVWPNLTYHWPNLSDFGAFLSKVADTAEPPAELLTKILSLLPSAQEGALLCVGQDEGHTIVETTEGFLADVVLPPIGPLINSLPGGDC
jgi:hypothetical protein